MTTTLNPRADARDREIEAEERRNMDAAYEAREAAGRGYVALKALAAWAESAARRLDEVDDAEDLADADRWIASYGYDERRKDPQAEENPAEWVVDSLRDLIVVKG